MDVPLSALTAGRCQIHPNSRKTFSVGINRIPLLLDSTSSPCRSCTSKGLKWQIQIFCAVLDIPESPSPILILHHFSLGYFIGIHLGYSKMIDYYHYIFSLYFHWDILLYFNMGFSLGLSLWLVKLYSFHLQALRTSLGSLGVLSWWQGVGGS